MAGGQTKNVIHGKAKRYGVRLLTPIIFLLGCQSDNRISLNEFLCLQERYRQEITTTALPVTTQPVNLDRALGPYRVGPSDILAISLTRMDDIGVVPPVQVRVERNGEIRLPMVGRVQVNDLELEDVENVVRKAYVPKFYHDVSVHAEVIQAQPTNVMVVGSVTAPGLVPLRRTERNLLFAIIGAGGASNIASGKVSLQRLRQPGKDVTLNLLNPEELKAALTLPPLENGDIVTVQAAVPNIIFVGGLVNAPQPEVYPPGVEISFLQAIAGAGGLRTDLTPKEATLIRRMPDGCDVHVKLNIDRIVHGLDPNLSLVAGDILWVPYTWQTRVEEWINQHFYLRFGAAATVNYNVNGIEYLNRRNEQSGGGNYNSLQDTYDPLGFLNRNSALQTLLGR